MEEEVTVDEADTKLVTGFQHGGLVEGFLEGYFGLMLVVAVVDAVDLGYLHVVPYLRVRHGSE